jgi:hypothetical protein
MPFDDPTAWLKTATAIKTMFDGVRSAIGMVRDVNLITAGSTEQKQVVETALATASSSAAIAELEIATALGYQLCRCDFPPTVMLAVGYFERDTFMGGGHGEGDPVYECPKCGYNTANPYTFKRLKPGRTPDF